MDSNSFSQTLPTIVIDKSFQSASLGLIYYTPDGKVLHANPAVQKIFGFGDDKIENFQLHESTHPDDLYRFDGLIDTINANPNHSHTIEIRCFDAQGQLLYIRVLFCAIMGDDNEPKYILAIVEDLTPQHAALEEKRLNRHLFETISAYSPTTVWLSTFDWDEVLFVNDAFCEVWQLEKDEILGRDGRKMLERIHPDDVDKVKNLVKAGPDEKDKWFQEFRLIKKDGEIRHIQDKGRLVRDENGEPRYLLGTHHDVTEKVVYMEKLELLNSELQKAYDKVKRLSEYDSLTNCLNRAAMMNRLSDALYQYNRYEIPATIIFLDLNGFKQVNDKYGHYVGDQVLSSFVEKMQGLIRQTDILGRMGGDEFLLLFPGANALSAEQFIRKSQKQFETVVDIPNKTPFTITLNYAAGFAEIDLSVNNVDEWIDIADRAMYVDKISSQ